MLTSTDSYKTCLIPHKTTPGIIIIGIFGGRYHRKSKGGNFKKMVDGANNQVYTTIAVYTSYALTEKMDLHIIY